VEYMVPAADQPYLIHCRNVSPHVFKCIFIGESRLFYAYLRASEQSEIKKSTSVLLLQNVILLL